jgi:hypothetical protein
MHHRIIVAVIDKTALEVSELQFAETTSYTYH